MDSTLAIAEYLLIGAIAFIALALVCDLVVVTTRTSSKTRIRVKRGAPATKEPALVGASAKRSTDSASIAGEDRKPAPSQTHRARRTRRGLPKGLALYGTGFTFIALVLVTVYLGIRMSLTGYGPFANQHEFAVSFVWGILLAYLVAEYVFQVRALSLAVLPVCAALTIYALSLPTEIEPLIPALQNKLLLTLHVGFATLAYGAACVSFGAAVFYLLRPSLARKIKNLPSLELLDDIGYKAATVTFPLLTIMIVLGSVWANTAWGRYWGWDPKETAALVTWLIYGAYLHARVTRSWRGRRSAWLLVIGFAAILFAYFGNHFFGGLHSYA